MVDGRIYLTSGRKSLICALDPHRRDPALALLEGKAHALALVELPQAGMLHGADMHENIIATRIGRDEAIAFSRIEPFHHSGEGRTASGFRAWFGFLHRFHFDTFLTGLDRTWVIAAGLIHRRFAAYAHCAGNINWKKRCCGAANLQIGIHYKDNKKEKRKHFFL
jgi:hypothetical protein